MSSQHIDHLRNHFSKTAVTRCLCARYNHDRGGVELFALFNFHITFCSSETCIHYTNNMLFIKFLVSTVNSSFILFTDMPNGLNVFLKAFPFLLIGVIYIEHIYVKSIHPFYTICSSKQKKQRQSRFYITYANIKRQCSRK